MSRNGLADLARLIPVARFVPIEGCNHYTILLTPEAVDAVVGAINALLPDSSMTGCLARAQAEA